MNQNPFDYQAVAQQAAAVAQQVTAPFVPVAQAAATPVAQQAGAAAGKAAAQSAKSEGFSPLFILGGAVVLGLGFMALASKGDTKPAMASGRLLPTTEEFCRSYMETALWSSTDNADDSGGKPLDENYDTSDIAPETRAQMKRDCQSFLDANWEDVDGKYGRAGHDFWLTRNRHGAGFWDGDWPEPAATRLTNAAHAYGSFDLYVGDDGKVHGS